ncbi:MAG: ABC transporter ATP-binding protein [Anaerolineales bacterium]
MTTMTATPKNAPYFDLHASLPENRLKGLWKMMTGYRLAYTGATIALAISALAKTLTFSLLRYFTDTVLPAGKVPGDDMNRALVWIALGFIGLASVEGGFAFLSGRLASYTAEGITRRVRNYLFDHLQRLSFAYHDKTPTGDQIERVTSDVDSMRRFFSEQAIGAGRIVLMFTINLIAILQLNVTLGLASVVTVPFIVGVSIWFFGKVSKAYEVYQEQEAILSTTLQENLTGVRVVKAFARQDYEKGKFEKDNWEKFRRGRKLTRMNALFWPLSDILCAAQMLGGIFFAAVLAINGTISLGSYIAYVGLLTWLIWPMRNLGRLIVDTSSGLVSYTRLMEIIKQEREPLTNGKVHPSGSARGEVVFENIGFAYDGADGETLKDISFRCEPGQAIALLGSTGSGKTSLVNLLPRFYDYSGGSLRLDGVELTDYPREYLRRQIGIVEQEPFLFSRSIRENIACGVGRAVTQDEIETAARAAAVHDVIMTFPNGYNTLVGEKGVTLSGGQKQRVAIARTLLKNPRILILDDSTSSVDMETEAEIREALNGLMQNRSTFIIAHRIQSVMNADLIVVLDKGRIVQMGKHADLLDEDGMYRQIYDIQMRVDDELEEELFES